MEMPTFRQPSLCRNWNRAGGKSMRFGLKLSPVVLLILLFVCSALGPDSAAAQQRDEVKVADTSSPRATLKSFLDACNEIHDLIHAKQYLDRTTAEDSGLAARALDCIDRFSGDGLAGSFEESIGKCDPKNR